MNRPHFGLTGLAVMGQNLARNIAHKGFPIVVHNRTTEKTTTFLKEHGSEGQITGETDVAAFVQALEPPRAIMLMVKAGQPVLLPTDTVYGLVTSAQREEHATRVYRLKGREATQPTAMLAPSIEMLFDCLPELEASARTIVRALLPGPYTLILPNPARRYRWLTGVRPDAIGVRVPVK